MYFSKNFFGHSRLEQLSIALRKRFALPRAILIARNEWRRPQRC
jgi:hypothetical protein